MATDVALPGEGNLPASPQRRRLSPYAGPASPTDGPHFNIGTLLRVIREWRWVILGTTALGLAAAIVLTLLTTPMYRAWVTLEVNPPTVEILDENSRDGSSSGAVWDFIATQVGLLSSRTLAERVAQDLNLASREEVAGTGGNASQRLQRATSAVTSGLAVDTPEEGQLIKFSYSNASPQLAAEIANGVAENFIATGLQRKYEASTYARTFLQQQIAKTRRDLERTERELVAYAQAQGIINTGGGKEGEEGEGGGSLQSASLVALNSALADATARRVQAEGAYRQARLAGGSAEVSSGTSALRQARATVEAEYQEKRTLMKPDHPEMQSLRARIDELDRQIASERSQVAGGRATTLLADYRAALSAENSLRSQVAQLKGAVLNLRGRSIQYNILQRELDTNRGLYDALLQRYKEVGVAAGVGTTPVSIVDRAEIPGGPYKPNLLFNLLVGLAVGLASGLAAAMILEIVNDTIKTREDVRTKLGLACLGAIPKHRGKGSLINDFSDPASPVSEAYAAVLASLRFTTTSGAPRTLLITSTRASEGKSSSALALAQNSARRGNRVLLIDADLRRPSFRVDNKKVGLTKLLTNDEAINGHVLRTELANLSLLPCGPVPPNPADLLSTGRFKEILRQAESHFDTVVIDGPPMLGLADASLLAAACRYVMVVIESGKTRTNAAREAIERIEDGNGHIVGVTLTKSTEESSYYGYRLYNYGALDHSKSDNILITRSADES